ncbi:hypothetical protein GCM10007901_07860 [Dyella acidisoli]|uniref:Secreted protein n=1 Tax=Dyella acidisoli TaxID=1867834 RepID=A0ABQ5XMQ2_9GAMM|nr:hypothetical protein GCM10007901_07860 [Dyella acidisoli]
MLLVLAEAGSLAGFTPGSFMPGGGGAGAKCGVADEEDEVCAKADGAARSERASKQAACFMTGDLVGGLKHNSGRFARQ